MANLSLRALFNHKFGGLGGSINNFIHATKPLNTKILTQLQPAEAGGLISRLEVADYSKEILSRLFDI